MPKIPMGRTASLQGMPTRFDERNYTYWIGVDPARKRDYFGIAVHALPRAVTDPWLPFLVYLDQHRGMKYLDAIQDLLDGPLRRFRGFSKLTLDATHDETLGELLEERFPSRVNPFHFTITSKEDLWRNSWWMMKIGYMLPGLTGARSFDSRVETLRTQMRRERVVTTESGRLKIEHGGKHNDLLDAWRLSLYDLVKFMRRSAGGLRAMVATVDSARGAWRDPTLRLLAGGGRLAMGPEDGPRASRLQAALKMGGWD